MSGVFLSYRREDSRAHTVRLSKHLALRFGRGLVFRDEEDIKPGSKWHKDIMNAITACDAFLLMIGTNWLDVKNSAGQRRLDDPEDVLLNEILHAFKHDRTVIPVLLNEAKMPPCAGLPEAIKGIRDRQYVRLRDAEWADDVAFLLSHLQALIVVEWEQRPLNQTRQELIEMQYEYFRLLEPDPQAALQLAYKALDILDRVLPIYPQDSNLLLLRGYFHKNEAMAWRSLENGDEFVRALQKADLVFRTMLGEVAGAWNGLGSVMALAGHYERSLTYIDRALELDPNFAAARRDRAQITALLEKRKAAAA